MIVPSPDEELRHGVLHGVTRCLFGSMTPRGPMHRARPFCVPRGAKVAGSRDRRRLAEADTETAGSETAPILPARSPAGSSGRAEAAPRAPGRARRERVGAASEDLAAAPEQARGRRAETGGDDGHSRPRSGGAGGDRRRSARPLTGRPAISRTGRRRPARETRRASARSGSRGTRGSRAGASRPSTSRCARGPRPRRR